MSAQGQQIDPNVDPIYFGQDFYVYTANFGNMAPLATATVNVAIQSDSDFEWIESTVYGQLHLQAAPFTTIPLPISLQLTDSGSSRLLFSAAVPLTSIAGDGRQAFILPVSRLFKAYSNIQALATSLDAANTYDFVFYNFIGRKLFLR